MISLILLYPKMVDFNTNDWKIVEKLPGAEESTRLQQLVGWDGSVKTKKPGIYRITPGFFNLRICAWLLDPPLSKR
jgi:hypothetical protein